MTLIRLWATEEEVKALAKDLEKHYEILSVSSPDRNRNGEWVRVYVELEMRCS